MPREKLTLMALYLDLNLNITNINVNSATGIVVDCFSQTFQYSPLFVFHACRLCESVLVLISMLGIMRRRKIMSTYCFPYVSTMKFLIKSLTKPFLIQLSDLEAKTTGLPWSTLVATIPLTPPGLAARQGKKAALLISIP